MRILVAYGSRNGATAEIAEKIGEVLNQQGLAADVISAEQVKDISLYQAVVLGSAVYIGSWRKEAAKFLRTHRKFLAEHPVWLFSSGPVEPGPPEETLNGWRFPSGLQELADQIKPKDIVTFHGKYDKTKLSRLERWMSSALENDVTDLRDWEQISAWAMGIAETLKQPA